MGGGIPGESCDVRMDGGGQGEKALSHVEVLGKCDAKHTEAPEIGEPRGPQCHLSRSGAARTSYVALGRLCVSRRAKGPRKVNGQFLMTIPREQDCPLCPAG